MARKRREPTIDVRTYRLSDGTTTETYSVRGPVPRPRREVS